MSTPSLAQAVSPLTPSGHTAPVAQFVRVVVGEWTKLRSVRSTTASLLMTAVVCVGFAVLLASGMVSRWDHLRPQQRADFHPATFSVSGVLFGQLVIGALGVLVMTAEYSTGTIRASVAAVPQRLALYLAKVVVFAVTAFVVAVVTTTLAFLVAQRILAAKGIGVGLFDPGVTRIVIGAALFLVAVGLLGLGLGALVRHTAGAISTVFGLMLVLDLLSGFLPADWQEVVDRWMPLEAGTAVMQPVPEPYRFGPWVGLGVLAGYALIALLAGAVQLARRDA